eukprot:scaffold1886_cov232-Ochromonas_danica.AAC.2
MVGIIVGDAVLTAKVVQVDKEGAKYRGVGRIVPILYPGQRVKKCGRWADLLVESWDNKKGCLGERKAGQMAEWVERRAEKKVGWKDVERRVERRVANWALKSKEMLSVKPMVARKVEKKVSKKDSGMVRLRVAKMAQSKAVLKEDWMAQKLVAKKKRQLLKWLKKCPDSPVSKTRETAFFICVLLLKWIQQVIPPSDFRAFVQIWGKRVVSEETPRAKC